MNHSKALMKTKMLREDKKSDKESVAFECYENKS